MVTAHTKDTKGGNGSKPVKIRDIDVDLWRQIRICAMRRGQTVREFVIDSCKRNMKGGAA